MNDSFERDLGDLIRRVADHASPTLDDPTLDHSDAAAAMERIARRGRAVRARRRALVAAGAVVALALAGGTARLLTTHVSGAPSAAAPSPTGSATASAAAPVVDPAFTAWLDALPRLDAAATADLPTVRGREGAPTLTYRGRTVNLPADVVGAALLAVSPRGPVLALTSNRIAVTRWGTVDATSRLVVWGADGALKPLAPPAGPGGANLTGQNPLVSPDGTTIAYAVPLPEASTAIGFVSRWGITLTDLDGRPVTPRVAPPTGLTSPFYLWGPAGLVGTDDLGRILVWHPDRGTKTIAGPVTAFTSDGTAALRYEESKTSGCVVDLTTGRPVPRSPCIAPDQSAVSLGPRARWAIVDYDAISAGVRRTLGDGVADLGTLSWPDDHTILALAAPAHFDLTTVAPDGRPVLPVPALVRCDLPTGACARVASDQAQSYLPSWGGVIFQPQRVTGPITDEGTYLRWLAVLGMNGYSGDDQGPQLGTAKDRILLQEIGEITLPGLIEATSWHSGPGVGLIGARVRERGGEAGVALRFTTRSDTDPVVRPTTRLATGIAPPVFDPVGERLAIVTSRTATTLHLEVRETTRGSLIVARDVPGERLVQWSEAGIATTGPDPATGRPSVWLWAPSGSPSGSPAGSPSVESSVDQIVDAELADPPFSPAAQRAVQWGDGCIRTIDLAERVVSAPMGCGTVERGTPSPDGTFLASGRTVLRLGNGERSALPLPEGVTLGPWHWTSQTQVIATVTPPPAADPALRTVIRCDVLGLEPHGPTCGSDQGTALLRGSG